MELSVHAFEELYEFNNRIKPVGILYKSFEPSSSFVGIYRLFEDGSMRVHYVVRDRKESKVFGTRPAYRIAQSHDRFDALLDEAKLATLPERINLAERERELICLDTTQYQDYLQEEASQNEEKLSDKIKPKIASKARQMIYPMSYKSLLEDHSDRHTQEEIFSFLAEMQQYEPIELIENTINIPSVLQNTSSSNPELHQKLVQAHTKEVKLASTILRPLKQQDNSMEYLPHVSFESTTTTKVLASCWSLNDKPYSELVFPEYDTESVPVPETFPSVQATTSSLTASVPTIVLEDIEDELPDIPTVASVKIKSSSQKKEEQEEEEEEPLFMSSQNASRSTLLSLNGLTSPARSFANVSTQPMAGAFGSRQKSVAKKKKKPKTSGFK
ncbi:hypothetical protein BD560DRAFT_209008 [Blakeslea trispora]|nr:hypothetical protein BD560DRAFT_209008 [Blakeslea trispora]